MRIIIDLSKEKVAGVNAEFLDTNESISIKKLLELIGIKDSDEIIITSYLYEAAGTTTLEWVNNITIELE